ncbi:conserved exported protein of unknown function [Magnetospirillum sp. XM-1]|uniref:hypothetical protein n=1 Tax=Magnetospirillum sp. XM-1 TaxID=1663591 RepID=UPI00073DB964|nr:hypothetical protein [Magnetospirillum sp. XM-1]CUW39885.1 conserved exported protein of unknown function [Magnetospirillum sp. XM-1]
MRSQVMLLSVCLLLTATFATNAQEGVFYSTDKGAAGVVKAAPPPIYPRDPGLPNYYSLGSKPSPPPITYDEINTPGYWHQERAAVLGKDKNGMTLHDRGEYCSAQEAKISRFAEISMQWLSDHDLWLAPSVGFIPHGIAMSESRDILTYAQVAFRDLRYIKHDGAIIQHCDEVAAFAIMRMQKLLAKFPEDPGWIERSRE